MAKNTKTSHVKERQTESSKEVSVTKVPTKEEPKFSASEVKSVMDAGFDQKSAEKIIENKISAKAKIMEEEKTPVLTKPKIKKRMIGILSVGEKGFRRCGYVFSSSQETFIDPEIITDEMWAKFEEAVNLKVLNVREVEVEV